MEINYLTMYMVADYLMDLKDKILVLEDKLKTCSSTRKPLIKAQIAIYFQQGIEALTILEYDCPKSVKDYFLGARENKPKFQEITSEMEERQLHLPSKTYHNMIQKAFIFTIAVILILSFFLL